MNENENNLQPIFLEIWTSCKFTPDRDKKKKYFHFVIELEIEWVKSVELKLWMKFDLQLN